MGPGCERPLGLTPEIDRSQMRCLLMVIHSSTLLGTRVFCVGVLRRFLRPRNSVFEYYFVRTKLLMNNMQGASRSLATTLGFDECIGAGAGCVLACSPARLLARSLAGLPARPPVCPACALARLPAYLLVSLLSASACLPACLPACPRACPLVSSPGLSSAFCLLACLSVFCLVGSCPWGSCPIGSLPLGRALF